MPGLPSLTELPPARLSMLQGSSPATVALAVSSRLNNPSIRARGDDAFYWGPEAANYFVFDNVWDELQFGASLPGPDAKHFIADALESVGLSYLQDSADIVSPTELSSGEQQRLLAALIASRPIAELVVAEPLIHVEAAWRRRIYDTAIASVLKRNGRVVVSAFDLDIPDRWRTNAYLIEISGDERPGSPEGASLDHLEPAEPSTAIQMSLNDIAYRHRNGSLGIDIQSLSIHKGSITVVAGPNGGGKTSLFRLLTSRHRISPRARMVFGSDEVTRPLKDIFSRAQAGLMFQDTAVHLRGGTVSQFLSTSPAGCQFLIDFGLGPYLEEDFLLIPEWVRRGVLLARALADGSEFFVLDEPLDGICLQLFGVQAAAALVDVAQKGSTGVVITHSPKLALAVGSYFVWIENGRVESFEERSRIRESSALGQWLHGGEGDHV